MRYASGPLISYLNANTVVLAAWCYTLTLQNGTVYRWTGCDMPLSYGGHTFTSASDNGSTQPGIVRGAIRHARGLETQTLDMTLLSGQTVMMGGVPLPLFAHNGGFDGARVLLEWVPMGPGGWGDTSLGSVVIFEGAVASVDPETVQVVLHVKSDLERLAQPWPRVVFQPGCANAFGDAGCGKVLSTLTVSGTATGTPTSTTIPSALGQAAGYFALGTLTMTSGAASGARRTVSGFSGGTLTLSTPLPIAPSAGDTFTVTPGCDRSFATCGTKWSNQNRYRGCPWVPPPETTR
jgi:uncharacterized phage protein (TIGR02218 family)